MSAEALKEAESRLESFKLVSIKIRKTGSVTEQNPLPVLDLISPKMHEIELEKEYLIPAYMTNDDGPLMAAYTPRYESQRNELGELEEYKSMSKIGLNILIRPIPNDDVKKYLEENEKCKILFEVDKAEVNRVKKLIEELKASLKTKGKSE